MLPWTLDICELQVVTWGLWRGPSCRACQAFAFAAAKQWLAALNDVRHSFIP